MPFYSSTTNSANGPLDAIALIETGLTVHAGWSFIEQQSYTQNGVSKVSRIWKCLGSQNASGQDFHVLLTRNISDNTSFTVKLSEGYNATTHCVTRPACGNNNAAVSGVDWSIGNGTEYALTITTSAVGGMLEPLITLQQNIDVEHFVTISKSFIAYGCNQSNVPLGGFYVGNFNPAYSSTYNPVMLNSLGSSAGSGCTRWPNATTLPTASANLDAVLVPNGYPAGYVSTTSPVNDIYLGVVEAAQVAVVGIESNANSPATLVSGRGIRRGILPTSVMFWVTESSLPRNGDYITVSGVDYFRVGNGNTTFPSLYKGNYAVYVSKTSTY